jgi:hypothetical protein
MKSKDFWVTMAMIVGSGVLIFSALFAMTCV